MFLQDELVPFLSFVTKRYLEEIDEPHLHQMFDVVDVSGDGEARVGTGHQQRKERFTIAQTVGRGFRLDLGSTRDSRFSVECGFAGVWRARVE